MSALSAFVEDFIAGWVGGVTGLITGYPLDTVKVRQQNFSTSLLIATRETYKYEGVLGFFKGMASPLIVYGPSCSVLFACTNACMNVLNGTGPNSPNHVQEKPKFLFNFFIAGCVGGICQVGIMCPVELVKTTLQTSTEGKSPWVHNTNLLKFEGNIETYKSIIRYKGYRGLYTGFVPMAIRDAPPSGVYFVVYEALLPDNRKDSKWYHKIWAGGWAGIASISTFLPADVVKTRMQADDILYPTYNGMLDCAQKLYAEEGYKIFWKGLPVITLRAFPAHAMTFVGYEMTMEVISKLKRNSI